MKSRRTYRQHPYCNDVRPVEWGTILKNRAGRIVVTKRRSCPVSNGETRPFNRIVSSQAPCSAHRSHCSVQKCGHDIDQQQILRTASPVVTENLVEIPNHWWRITECRVAYPRSVIADPPSVVSLTLDCFTLPTAIRISAATGLLTVSRANLPGRVNRNGDGSSVAFCCGSRFSVRHARGS